MNDKDLKIFLSVLIFFVSVLPFVEELTGFKAGFTIPFCGIYIFYYLIGYMIHEERIFIPERICVFFIVLNFLYVIFGQFIPDNTVVSGARIKYLDNNSPLSVLMSIAIFSLVKSRSKQDKNLFDTFFAPISFGVYVLHPLFINFFLKFLRFNPSIFPCVLVNTVLFCVTLAGSIIAVWILRKFRFVRKYIL